MQGAWSAIRRTPVPGDDPGGGSFAAQHFQRALEAAVRGGRDTDTVAAIAGGLLGARWGASAAPMAWQRILHGWPGLRGRDLIALALCSAQNGQSEPDAWPLPRVFDYSAYGDTGVLAIHPHDRLVLLGGVDAVRRPPDEVDAVVSLCRLGSAEAPAPGVDPADHVEAWLTGSAVPGGNPNLDLVLAQAADTVALRDGPCWFTAPMRSAARRPSPPSTPRGTSVSPCTRHSATYAPSCPPHSQAQRSWPPSTSSARPPLPLKKGGGPGRARKNSRRRGHDGPAP
jgi:hypothetical protein